MNGKGSTVWLQVSCHKAERKPHHSSCLGNSWSARVLWENRYLVFVNSHRRFFFNFLLCSLTCEMYITLQWCFSAHRDKGKTFWFFFFFGCTGSVSCMAISLFETSGGYSLLAGCMASHHGGFFCCGAPALGTRASVVSLPRLRICPSA